MRQLFENPSWGAIWSLPPTEFLALVLLAILGVAAAYGLWVASVWLSISAFAPGERGIKARVILMLIAVTAALSFGYLA
jgi:hypothetical protein